MAPELWRSESATPATDIYALGTVLFELAAGRAPFEEKGIDGYRASILN